MLNINDHKDRLVNAEDNMKFCAEKYQQLLEVSSNVYFDIDSELLYRK